MDFEIKEAIKKISKLRLSEVIDTMSPSQYDSELIKDIEQDLYLEFYKLKSKNPKIKVIDSKIEKRLLKVRLGSMPDKKMVYVGELSDSGY